MKSPDLAAMRRRVSFLRRQADSFRKMSAIAANRPLAEEFEELARRCDEIAATIDRNLQAGIYDWKA